MYMIEISEDKMSGLYEYIEKGLKYMGKAMQCVDELKSESKYNKRSYEYDEDDDERFNSRGRMSGRYNRY